MKMFIVRGLPGSGKTTFAKHLQRCEGACHFEADNFFVDSHGTYQFDASKLGEAHKWCLNGTESAMRMGHCVIISNTFTTEREMEPYLELAKEYNYQVTSIIIENRHGSESVHNVPDETLDRMKNRFSVKL